MSASLYLSLEKEVPGLLQALELSICNYFPVFHLSFKLVIGTILFPSFFDFVLGHIRVGYFMSLKDSHEKQKARKG